MEIVHHEGDRIGIILSQDEFIAIERLIGGSSVNKMMKTFQDSYANYGYHRTMGELCDILNALYGMLSTYSFHKEFDTNGEDKWN